MSRLGNIINLPASIEPPVVLFFVSTFCSKCLYNRQILQKFINDDNIVEIDIAKQGPVMEAVKPRMAPTVTMVDPQGQVIFYEEGILHDQTVQSLQLLMSRYLE